MYHYKSDGLTQKQQYKFMSGSVVPRPIAWVTSLNENNDVVNLAPFSFFSGASNKVPLITVSILRNNNGRQKDTTRNVLASKEAVVHIVTEELDSEMNISSSLLPSEKSEIDLTNLHLIESQSVQVPSLKEAKIRFETKLYQHVKIPDESGHTVTDMLILKITDFYFHEDIFNFEDEYIKQDELKPIARLSGNNYATLDKSYKMIRPDHK